MAVSKDPNSTITTDFKQSQKPAESIRVVSRTPDPDAEALVRRAIQQGSNAKKPSLNKAQHPQKIRRFRRK